jgi:hypothetical protein
MFKPKESSQNEFEFVSIDELVPDDQLHRLIDKYIDFSGKIERSFADSKELHGLSNYLYGN